MAERSPSLAKEMNGINGVKSEDGVNGVNGQSVVSDSDKMSIDTPIASTSRMSETRDMSGEFEQPPAKRARKLSDADQASLAHVSLYYLYNAVLGRANTKVFKDPSSSHTIGFSCVKCSC